MWENPATQQPGQWSSSPNWYGQPPLVPLQVSSDRHGWLPVLSLAVSLLALLGVVGIAVLLLVGSGSSSGSTSTLTGQVRLGSAHMMLPGHALEVVIRDVLERDGDDVSTVACPSTPRVSQGVVSVCHGIMDGDSYAFIVYFENDQGGFTLQPI